MAKIEFSEVGEFEKYMGKFSGSGRMYLYICEEDRSVVLRPAVTTKGVDSAVVRGISDDKIKEIKEKFGNEDMTFTIRNFHWKEDTMESPFRSED